MSDVEVLREWGKIMGQCAEADALARVLAVAEAAVALVAHRADESYRYNSPGSMAHWDRKLEGLDKAHTTAVAALLGVTKERGA